MCLQWLRPRPNPRLQRGLWHGAQPPRPGNQRAWRSSPSPSSRRILLSGAATPIWYIRSSCLSSWSGTPGASRWGGWRGAMKPLGTQAFHPFSLPGHCSPRFPACGLDSASLYLCLWQCPRRARPDGLESGFRTTPASNPAWACAGRGSGRRQPMVRSRALRRARGYYGGRATLGAAQRCRRRPGPGDSAALPTFPHAGC